MIFYFFYFLFFFFFFFIFVSFFFIFFFFFFFFSSRRRHTRFDCDWSSDVCSSDLPLIIIDQFHSPVFCAKWNLLFVTNLWSISLQIIYLVVNSMVSK